ncbi:MAG: general secretion pathway protein M [Desulforhopalus sp.]|jgi:general secretion pathway protein M
MTRLVDKEILKNLWEKSGIKNLESRERLFLIGGVAFLICFMLLRFAVIPAIHAKSRLERSTEQKSKELVKIQELQQEYLTLKKEEGTIQAMINQRGTEFSLFTFLDQQAERVQVKKQIKYMKPSVIEGEDSLNETMVEMKFQLISLEALVGFLRLVESKQNVVFVKRISIQENGTEAGSLDAILQIVTFEEKQ